MHRVLRSSARRWTAAVALAGAVILAGCAAAPDGSGASKDGPSAVLPSTEVGSVRIPLPPGTWRTVLTREEPFKAGRGRDTWTVSARVRDGVVERLVLAQVVEAGAGAAFGEQKTCQRDTYYFQTITVKQRGRGDCWHVRYANFGLQQNPHWLSKEVDAFLRREGLSMSVVMPGVRFVRHDGPLLVQVEYLWNPDVLLRPRGRPIWLPADWENAAVRADPERRAVMEMLRRWGEDWHPNIVRAVPF